MRVKILAAAAVAVLLVTFAAVTVSCQGGKEGPTGVPLPEATDSYKIVEGIVYDTSTDPPLPVGAATVIWTCSCGAQVGADGPTPNSGWYYIVRDDDFSDHAGHTLTGYAYHNVLGQSKPAYIYNYNPLMIPYYREIYY